MDWRYKMVANVGLDKIFAVLFGFGFCRWSLDVTAAVLVARSRG